MDALTFMKGHVPLFAGLSDEALTSVATEAQLKTYAADQVVVRAGMTVDALYVVATGRVEIHARVSGKGTARVAELGLGEVFGEASILDQSVAGATAKAGAEGALLLLLTESSLRGLMERDPAFAARFSALSQSRRTAQPA